MKKKKDNIKIILFKIASTTHKSYRHINWDVEIINVEDNENM
jgi:hypothetical protein